MNSNNYSTELYHGFKYIRKYMKNGKWHYVYDDKKTRDQIEGAQGAAAAAFVSRNGKTNRFNRAIYKKSINAETLIKRTGNLSQQTNSQKAKTQRRNELEANRLIENNSINNKVSKTIQKAKNVAKTVSKTIDKLKGGQISVKFNDGTTTTYDSKGNKVSTSKPSQAKITSKKPKAILKTKDTPRTTKSNTVLNMIKVRKPAAKIKKRSTANGKKAAKKVLASIGSKG